MKQNTKLWRARKQAVARLPRGLRTVAIAKQVRTREPGTFGAASAVVVIDPKTGRPRAA